MEKKEKQFKQLKKPKKVEKKDELKIKELNNKLASLDKQFGEIILSLIREINQDPEVLQLISDHSVSLEHYELIQNTKLKSITF